MWGIGTREIDIITPFDRTTGARAFSMEARPTGCLGDKHPDL